MLLPHEKGKKIQYEVGGQPGHADYSWYRGEHCNFSPRLENLFSDTSVTEFILKGWLPPKAFIGKKTRVTSFGSCFAKHIGEYLNSRKYSFLPSMFSKSNKNSYVISHSEGLVTTFAIRQQFEWAFEKTVFEGELWYGYEAEKYAYSEDVRQNTLELFQNTDVFILTFGLSEIWFDTVTNGVFWRGVPLEMYDPDRHKFRVSSHAENLENLRVIYALIRKHRPDAKIVMTLSPVPLVATFREHACITANAVSKGILRVALDDLCREVANDGVLNYWPAYEIVTEFFKNPYLVDRRHIKPKILEFIMRLFEEHYCEGITNKSSLLDICIRAHVADGLYDIELYRALKKDTPSKVLDWLKTLNDTDYPEMVALIIRRWKELHPQSNDLDDAARRFGLNDE